MSATRWSKLLLIVFVVSFSGRPAMGQPAVETVPTEKPAVSIEASRIPESTETLQQTLYRLSTARSSDPAVAAVEDDLPAITEQIKIRLDQTRALLSASPTHEQLRSFQRDWERGLVSLSDRRRTLARRAQNLEGEVAELARLDEIWRLTLSNATGADTPREMIATVRSNLDAISVLATQVKERRNRTLRLLTLVSEREFEASEAIRKISEKRAELRSQLFEPDAPPLWSAGPWSDAPSALTGVAREAKLKWADLVDFSTSRTRSFVPIAFTLVLSLAFSIYLRERMRKRVIEGHLEGAASVFERPISVATLTTLIVADSITPFLPSLGRELSGVLLMVPVLRLLMPAASEMARGLLGTVATFYLIDRLRVVIEPAALLERSVFLVEMVAAFVVVTLLVRPSRMAAMPKANAPPAALGGGLRVAMFVFLVSVVSNLFGYVAFSKLIGDGALQSIDLALVAYAGYRITTTLVVILFSSGGLQRIGALRNNSGKLIHWIRQTLAIIAVLLWGLGTLDAFEIRDLVLGFAKAFLSTPVEIGTLSISLRDIAAFPLTIFVAYSLSRAIRSLLEEDVFTRVTLHRGVDNAVSTTVHYVLLLAGFFLALGAAGIDFGKFTLLAGALGVGIGFGLQGVVNNFVSGLILLYERPIKVGDTVELVGLLGEVKHIGIRASTILTFQGAEVIIPNGNLLSEQLINWTLSNKHRRVEIPVGVAYGNNPSAVIAVLKRVLDAETRVLDHPEPTVLFRGFGESSLDFELRFWARDYMTYLVLASDLAAAVYDELERVGIEIPFPQRDLHIKSIDGVALEKLRTPPERSE